jgi:hypothetical protein
MKRAASCIGLQNKLSKNHARDKHPTWDVVCRKIRNCSTVVILLWWPLYRLVVASRGREGTKTQVESKINKL